MTLITQKTSVRQKTATPEKTTEMSKDVSSRNNRKKVEGWVAVYTKPNQERTALANIERQGFEAYCPMILKTRRHARKTDKVLRPLFPSYIFTHLSQQKCQWRSLLSTYGVQSVVQFEGKLGLMPDGLIEEFRSYEKTGLLKQVVAPKIKPGMQVRMTEGPFENLIAEVLCLPEKDRVWLLLDLMGRKVRIQNDLWTLTQKI